MEKKEGKAPTRKKDSMSKSELEQALLNNFVNLQKVLTNLSIKFDELSDNISKLLQLFEISAKSFAEKYSGEGEETNGGDTQMLSKLDSLLDQNKTIAKGIMMMEEKIRQKVRPAEEEIIIKTPEPKIPRPKTTEMYYPTKEDSYYPAKEDSQSQFEGMTRSKSLEEK